MPILKIIQLIICIILLILAIFNYMNIIQMEKIIMEQQEKINSLEFDKEYIEYVYQDNIKQERENDRSGDKV